MIHEQGFSNNTVGWDQNKQVMSDKETAMSGTGKLGQVGANKYTLEKPSSIEIQGL